MKGTILDYSIQNNAGVISRDDEQYYTLTGLEWRAAPLAEGCALISL